ncbi:RmlC-like cupin domain-containing protein [Aspergillus fruticulosus]
MESTLNPHCAFSAQEAGKAYALKSLCGEIYYIPFSKSAMRLLVTGKVSDGSIALHREAHDVFLCLKGHINVWANNQARTIGPGDFASVPPGVIHQYQTLGDRSEFIGLIVPGGWEDFFRLLGEPYAGAMWPATDDRNPVEVLLPRLKEAAERFDMVPQPHVQPFVPQPWVDGQDNVLPGDIQPYFLRAGTEPAYRLGGSVVRVLSTMKESGGKFAIGSLEGSSFYEDKLLAAGMVFASVHHAFHIIEGTFGFDVDGAAVTLTAAETLYVPKGSRVKLHYRSSGLVELFAKAGEEYALPIIPEAEGVVDPAGLERVSREMGIILG